MMPPVSCVCLRCRSNECYIFLAQHGHQEEDVIPLCPVKQLATLKGGTQTSYLKYSLRSFLVKCCVRCVFLRT